MSGNVFDGQAAYTADNYRAISFDRWATGGYRHTTLERIRVDQPFDVSAACPRTDSADATYDRVLRGAGASLRRDAADERLVAGIRNRTNRLIDSQDEVGGWPTLKSASPRLDTDGDGMPDVWERSHGLNPADANDRNGDRDRDGFTNLEEYINHL